MATGARFQVVETGYLRPLGLEASDALRAGEVGYFAAAHQKCKRHPGGRYGDRRRPDPAAEPLPGYRKVQPMVFSGMYPADGAKYPDLRDALEQAEAQRRVADLSSRKPRSRWASDSAAAFSACSTWRSSRNGWSGNTIWTSSPPRPASFTVFKRPTAKQVMIDNPTQLPRIPRRSNGRRSPLWRRSIITPHRLCRQYHGTVPGAARASLRT